MKSMIFKGALLSFTLLGTGLAFAAGQGQTEKAKTETKAVEDKGKPLFEKVCAECHGLDMATSLRYTKDQWQTLVQSMVDKGASLKKEEIPTVVDYLTATYGVKQMVEDACSGCHDYTPVAEQRLSKDDWDSLVRAMVDRGAYLNKEQIILAVEYLAKTYPNK